MDSQLKYLEEVTGLFDEFKQELPEAYEAQKASWDAVYQDGALSTKTKRLMAMAIAVRVGCPGCITFQTKLAVEAGATKAEVVEAALGRTGLEIHEDDPARRAAGQLRGGRDQHASDAAYRSPVDLAHQRRRVVASRPVERQSPET